MELSTRMEHIVLIALGGMRLKLSGQYPSVAEPKRETAFLRSRIVIKGWHEPVLPCWQRPPTDITHRRLSEKSETHNGPDILYRLTLNALIRKVIAKQKAARTISPPLFGKGVVEHICELGNRRGVLFCVRGCEPSLYNP